MKYITTLRSVTGKYLMGMTTIKVHSYYEPTTEQAFVVFSGPITVETDYLGHVKQTHHLGLWLRADNIDAITIDEA